MSRGRDIVDIAGLASAPPGGEASSAGAGASADPGAGNTLRGRPWLAILFRCCQAYSRVYRNVQGSAYEGRCPRCQRPLRVPIGPGGTATRFFEAE